MQGDGQNRRRRAVVLGMVRSGRAAARLLLSEGYDIVALDRTPPAETEEIWPALEKIGSIQAIWGEHPLSALDNVEILVRSPGVRHDIPLLKEARRRRIEVVSELELAFRRIRSKIMALTGTNGKSTTTAWLAHILRESGRMAVAVGNIGRPLSDAVLEEPLETCFVVEVSSFQLEDISTFRPHVGALLNITPDHLDRYASLDAYTEAKWNLFSQQGSDDWAVLPPHLSRTRSLPSAKLHFGDQPLDNGVFGSGEEMNLERDGKRETIISLNQLPLPGPHNRQNAMAAAAAAVAYGLRVDEIVKGLRSFNALPHRMEPVGRANGVLWINDSKATNVESLEVAMKSFPSGIVLIAGGRDKEGDFPRLKSLAHRTIRHLILLGEAAETIKRAWPDLPATMAADLEEAVKRAGMKAQSGEVVLLSPGCASQDMFRDYEERGDLFRDLVRKIHPKVKSCGRDGEAV